jgi:hypothetical protein
LLEAVRTSATTRIKTTKSGKPAKAVAVRGQPTKYSAKRFPNEARFLASRGATLAEIADCFGVSTRTLYYWNAKYPELRQAIDSGITGAFNPRIERALAERAIGYSVDEEHWFVVKGELESRIVRKHYPPDTTAGIYWTKNTMQKWRDVHRHDVNVAPLKSSDELRQLLLEGFKDYIDQGLLQLPAPNPKLKEINPKANGSGDGHSS